MTNKERAYSLLPRFPGGTIDEVASALDAAEVRGMEAAACICDGIFQGQTNQYSVSIRAAAETIGGGDEEYDAAAHERMYP